MLEKINCKQNNLLTKVSWRLIPFMILLYFIAYLDRINVSFAALQMNKDLKFSDETFGFGSGIFFLGYFLFGVPSNLMLQRFGARTWISLIMISWGIVSSFMAYAHDKTTFFVLRFLLGAFEAGFFPGMILYLTFWYPKKMQASSVALFMTAIPLSGILGGLISASILSKQSYLGIASWQWLFLLTGVPAVLLGILVYYFLPDNPQLCTWLDKKEKAELSLLISADLEKNLNKETSNKDDILTTLTNIPVWHLALIYFSITLAMYGYQLWLPQIVKNIGEINNFQSSLLCSLTAIFQAIGMILISKNSDRNSERKIHLTLSLFIASLSLMGAAYFSKSAAPISFIFLCISAFGIWGTFGPFWSLSSIYLSAAQSACGIALINSVGNLGGFLGPYLIGVFKTKTADFTVPLYLLGMILFLASLLALAVSLKKNNSNVETN